MEHPLIGDISELNLDQLTERITELTKKIQIARNTGNGRLVHQLGMAMETYQNAYRARVEEQTRRSGDPDFSNKIDIA